MTTDYEAFPRLKGKQSRGRTERTVPVANVPPRTHTPARFTNSLGNLDASSQTPPLGSQTGKTDNVLWMSDATCRVCYKCEQPFSLMKRRHHCRSCGLIFCSACTPFTVSGRRYGLSGAVRVCHDCRVIALSAPEYVPTVAPPAQSNASDVFNDPTFNLSPLPLMRYSSNSSVGTSNTSPEMSRPSTSAQQHQNITYTSNNHRIPAGSPDRRQNPTLGPSLSTTFISDTIQLITQRQLRQLQRHRVGASPFSPVMSKSQSRSSSPEKRPRRRRFPMSSENECNSPRITRRFSITRSISGLSDEGTGSDGMVSDISRWTSVIADLAEEATRNVAVRTDYGDSMDVLDYVHVLVTPGDARESLRQQSKYVDGVVCVKNVANRRMRTHVESPRIMLIAGGIQYHQEPTRLANLDSLVEQEREFMSLMVKRICSRYRVDVLLLGSTAAILAQEKLQEAGVSLVQNVDAGLMSRISYFTGAHVMPSADYLVAAEDPTGTCGSWHVGNKFEQAESCSDDANHFVSVTSSGGGNTDNAYISGSTGSLGGGSSNKLRAAANLQVKNKTVGEELNLVGNWAGTCVPLMVFSGCPSHLGGTVLLRGPESLEILQELAWVLRIAISRQHTLVMLETLRNDLSPPSVSPSCEIVGGNDDRDDAINDVIRMRSNGISHKQEVGSLSSAAAVEKLEVDVHVPVNLSARRVSAGSNYSQVMSPQQLHRQFQQRQQRLQVLMLESDSILVTRIWLLDNVQRCEPKRARIHICGNTDQSLFQFLLSFAMLPRVLWPVGDGTNGSSMSSGNTTSSSSGATSKNNLVAWLANNYAIVFMHGSMVVRVSATTLHSNPSTPPVTLFASVSASVSKAAMVTPRLGRSANTSPKDPSGIGSVAPLSSAQATVTDTDAYVNGGDFPAVSDTIRESKTRGVADLFMWTHCPICDKSSTSTPLPLAVANLSFAKLLQTLLYSDTTDPLRSAVRVPCMENQWSDSVSDQEEEQGDVSPGHQSRVQLCFRRGTVVTTLACEPCPSFLLCTASRLTSWSPETLPVGARGNCLRIATASLTYAKVLGSMYASVEQCEIAVNALLDTLQARLKVVANASPDDIAFAHAPVMLSGVLASDIIESKREEFGTVLARIRESVEPMLETKARPSADTVRTFAGTHVRVVTLFSELWECVRRWNVEYQDEMIRSRMRDRLRGVSVEQEGNWSDTASEGQSFSTLSLSMFEPPDAPMPALLTPTIQVVPPPINPLAASSFAHVYDLDASSNGSELFTSPRTDDGTDVHNLAVEVDSVSDEAPVNQPHKDAAPPPQINCAPRLNRQLTPGVGVVPLDALPERNVPTPLTPGTEFLLQAHRDFNTKQNGIAPLPTGAELSRSVSGVVTGRPLSTAERPAQSRPKTTGTGIPTAGNRSPMDNLPASPFENLHLKLMWARPIPSSVVSEDASDMDVVCGGVLDSEPTSWISLAHRLPSYCTRIRSALEFYSGRKHASESDGDGTIESESNDYTGGVKLQQQQRRRKHALWKHVLDSSKQLTPEALHVTTEFDDDGRWNENGSVTKYTVRSLHAVQFHALRQLISCAHIKKNVNAYDDNDSPSRAHAPATATAASIPAASADASAAAPTPSAADTTAPAAATAIASDAADTGPTAANDVTATTTVATATVTPTATATAHNDEISKINADGALEHATNIPVLAKEHMDERGKQQQRDINDAHDDGGNINANGTNRASTNRDNNSNRNDINGNNVNGDNVSGDNVNGDNIFEDNTDSDNEEEQDEDDTLSDGFVESLLRCSGWEVTGGKSDAVFFRTSDERYVIKTVSAEEVSHFESIAPKYFAYMSQSFVTPTVSSPTDGNYANDSTTPPPTQQKAELSERPSLLAKIVGVFILQRTTTARNLASKERNSPGDKVRDSQMNILVMENTLWGASSAAPPDQAQEMAESPSGSGSSRKRNPVPTDEYKGQTTFDLKGNTRNRLVKNPEPGQVLLDMNFFQSRKGLPVALSLADHDHLHTAIALDTNFLASVGVIDYSMLVHLGTATGSGCGDGADCCCGSSARNDSMCSAGAAGCAGQRSRVFVGIIDYLQVYNYKKMIESNVKKAGMIAGQAEPTVIDPVAYCNRFVRSFRRYFVVSAAPQWDKFGNRLNAD